MVVIYPAPEIATSKQGAPRFRRRPEGVPWVQGVVMPMAVTAANSAQANPPIIHLVFRKSKRSAKVLVILIVGMAHLS